MNHFIYMIIKKINKEHDYIKEDFSINDYLLIKIYYINQKN